MTLQQTLEQTLQQAFDPIHLEVINESHMHSGPATESHFKVIIVSAQFNGLPLIRRHRAVHAALSELMPQFHALALHAWTPQEWEKRGRVAPASPACQGGHD